MKMKEETQQNEMINILSHVVYPIYEKCAEIETEIFWKQLLFNFQGNTPRSLSITKEGIYKCIRKSTKKPVLLVPTGLHEDSMFQPRDDHGLDAR
jgi:hypothetical protein